MLTLKPIKVALIILAAGILLAPGQDEKKYKFKVIITGMTSSKGVVRVALYNKRLFLTKNSIQSNVLEIEAGRCVWWVTKIEAGEYALLAFHDENNNTKLDKTFLGRPLEPHAYYAPREKKKGTPKFEEVKFSVDEKTDSVFLALPRLQK